MSEPATPEFDTETVAGLRRELASTQAELADVRRAADVAGRAASAARELNVALLAELDDPSRSPSFHELHRRSAELDKIYASPLWRWSAAPRRVNRMLRRVVARLVPGRRS